MEGKVFKPNISPPRDLQGGTGKEVNIDFIFDLQRFTTGTGTENDPYVVTTADELKSTIAGIASGSTVHIKLGANMTGTSYPTIAAGTNVNLDLNGFTYTSTGSYAFCVKGTFTLTDSSDNKTGTIVHNKSATSNAIYMYSTGTFNVNSGYIESTGYGINASGTATISSGKFKSGSSTGNDNVLQRLTNLSGVQSMDGVLLVGSGYTIENTGNTYQTVKMDGITYYATNQDDLPTAVAQIGTNNYSSLNRAINAASLGAEIKLLADATPGSAINVNKNLTLDLNGHSVTHTSYVFKVYAATANDDVPTLTVKDSGTGGKISGSSTLGAIYAGSSATLKGNVTIESGTIENVNTDTSGAVLYGYAGSKIKVNGGTLTDTNSNIAINVASSEDVTISSGGAYSLNINGKVKYYTTEDARAAAIETACFSEGSGDDIKYYTTLSEANSGCAEDATVTMLKDCESGAVSIKKNWTLDLNGNTLTSTGASYALYVNSAEATFTVTDNSESKAGAITSDLVQSTGLVYVNNGTFALQGGTLTSDTYAVRTNTTGTFNMSGGTVTISDSDNNGTFTYSDTNYGSWALLNAGTANISGGTITNKNSLAVNNQAGTLNVTGGNIESSESTAVYALGGTVTINGADVNIVGKTGIFGVNGTKITLDAGTIEGTYYGGVQLGYNNGNVSTNTTEYKKMFSQAIK